ncbi:MAG TPA: M48 family metallopeptidase, partial [Gemmatimonadaceae bacterium]|nr:M48 family metallopeptidase [Gemmatimonadaceae bacterium]
MKRFAAMGMLAFTMTACATISTQQEVEMGQQYSAQVNQQLPIIQDAEINRYINVLGDSIAGLSDDRHLDWHFFVVDSKEVNAFALPGGFIYINRGLIERADRLDEVAGVLGHEIGHVTNRHSVKLMEKQQAANVGVTLGCVLTGACENQATAAVVNVAGGAVFARFSREAEREADESGVRYVTRAGIDPRGIPSMFQKLLEERRTRPSAVAAWFSTHPLEEDRITDTQAMIARIDPLILQSLTRDSENFQAFKRRV